MFEIPATWADAYADGRPLGTGRMRDGGQGGMGPTLFAYCPWNEDGSPHPAGTRLEEITLLLYENAYNTEEFIRSLDGYQHPDEWGGGAWLTTSGDKAAVLFAGTKATARNTGMGTSIRMAQTSFVWMLKPRIFLPVAWRMVRSARRMISPVVVMPLRGMCLKPWLVDNPVRR